MSEMVINQFVGAITEIVIKQVNEKLNNINTKEDEKLLLKPEEVMRMLDVGSNTFYNKLLRDKSFPSMNIGRNIYVPKEQLLEWISKQVNNK